MEPAAEQAQEEKIVALAARHAVGQLRERLLGTVSPRAVEESARRLGRWRKGELVLGREDQRAAFDAYVLHEYRPGGPAGLNAVQRFERSAQLGEASNSLAFALAIMRLARFTMLEIGPRLDEAMLAAQDLFTGNDLRLADPTLDEEGVVVCGYAIPLGAFWIMDPGALLMAPDVATELLRDLEAQVPGPDGKVATRVLSALLAD
ncbi:MAG: hypothetical protein JWP97_4091 [Labilithrix sp.]|nr:hypothetical protein [Labilithrix sp.]